MSTKPYSSPNRIETFPDGVHQHLLKSTTPQEQPWRAVRGLFGRIMADKHKVSHNQKPLAIVIQTNQSKMEYERSIDDLKTGSIGPAVLTDKYGKCRKIIGYGSSGFVGILYKKDSNGKTSQLYAVKTFHRKPHQSAKVYQMRAASEFCISSVLRHTNIARTVDLLQDNRGNYCEVMEFCAAGDLFTLMVTTGPLEDIEADCFFKQLMRGVEYLHDTGVAHRDLKPENLLLTAHGCLKIADFGNAECFRLAWEKEGHMSMGLRGTRPYLAPEAFLNGQFDPRAVDVWATGVIYVVMRTGRLLWNVANRADENFEKYIERRHRGDGYQTFEILPGVYRRRVVYSILNPGPSRRITSAQVLHSEWCRKIRLCQAGDDGL